MVAPEDTSNAQSIYILKIKAKGIFTALWDKIFSRVELRLKNPQRGMIVTQNML